jgi:UDP-N-acetyl-D-glucosamine dehydrogenase
MKIAVIGLGSVGLPLAFQFAQSGVRVLGLDVDTSKVDLLNQGKSYVENIASETVARIVKSGSFSASSDFSRIREVSAIIICVPAQLNRNCEPDSSYVNEPGKSIARHLKRGMLVVLESITYFGKTDEELREVLEIGSGLNAGKDFHFAFLVPRENPSSPDGQVGIIPKFIAGYTQDCLQKALELYSLGMRQVVPLPSCRVAEEAKIPENTSQGVKIAS